MAMSEAQKAALYNKHQMAAAQEAARYANVLAGATTALGSAAEKGGKALDTRAGRSGTQSYGLRQAGRVMEAGVRAPSLAALAGLRALSKERKGKKYRGELGGAGGAYTGFIASGAGSVSGGAPPPPVATPSVQYG